MESRIAQELGLRRRPVAVVFTDRRPEKARRFREGQRGCVMSLHAAAARGETAVFDRASYGCPGGGVGLGFGNTYAATPEQLEDFCYFLSTGRGPGYREGEGYKKTPELARIGVEEMHFAQIPYTYVVFRPLDEVDPAGELPTLVTFYANPDQLSALVVLANYGRPGRDNVSIPFAAGCQTVCLLPYQESRRDQPRAVVGVTDISARPHLDPDLLTFTVPYWMFVDLEADVPGSFLERAAWRRLKPRIPVPEAI